MTYKNYPLIARMSLTKQNKENAQSKEEEKINYIQITMQVQGGFSDESCQTKENSILSIG